MPVDRPEPQQHFPREIKPVFSGKLFEVFQWPQQMYDGQIATFEHLRRVYDSVVIVPITDDNQIIVTHQEQPSIAPFWGMPSGMIEPGEESLAAARRELMEETGYQGRGWRLLSATQPLSKIDWAVYIWIAYDCTRQQPPHPDNGEKIDVQLFSFEDWLQLLLKPEFRDSELALRILRARQQPAEWQKMLQLFEMPNS